MAAGRPRRAERALGPVALVLLAVAWTLGLAVAPPDASQGQVQRLMYVHVPAAWLAYVAFAVLFVSSAAYLRGRRVRWDRIGHASAEIGVIFTVLAIGLGALWGRRTWGVWWSWDPRLTTTLVMLLVYVGYLMVRSLPEDPARRARWAAVVGLIGFVNVPIVHLSVTWWRSLHQPATVVRLAGPSMDPAMLVALLAGVVAFTLLYAYLLVLRLRVRRLEDRAETEWLRPEPAARSLPEVTS